MRACATHAFTLCAGAESTMRHDVRRTPPRLAERCLRAAWRWYSMVLWLCVYVSNLRPGAPFKITRQHIARLRIRTGIDILNRFKQHKSGGAWFGWLWRQLRWRQRCWCLKCVRLCVCMYVYVWRRRSSTRAFDPINLHIIEANTSSKCLCVPVLFGRACAHAYFYDVSMRA